MQSAIYLTADASDLLCDRSAEWTRFAMRELRDDQVRRRRNSWDWNVELCWPERGFSGSVIYAAGDISPHTDTYFPRHSLLWILRDSRALVFARGGQREPQKAGAIIGFDCHRRHALKFQRKPPHIPRLWCAFNLDSETPWTEERARAAIQKALVQ